MSVPSSCAWQDRCFLDVGNQRSARTDELLAAHINNIAHISCAANHRHITAPLQQRPRRAPDFTAQWKPCHGSRAAATTRARPKMPGLMAQCKPCHGSCAAYRPYRAIFAREDAARDRPYDQMERCAMWFWWFYEAGGPNSMSRFRFISINEKRYMMIALRQQPRRTPDFPAQWKPCLGACAAATARARPKMLNGPK
jgi:hypothetical protein